jgi:hypothetical protein
MRFVVFFAMCVCIICTNPPLVIRDSNSTRYTNIFVPTDEADFFHADLYRVDFFASPVIPVGHPKKSDDICSNTEILLRDHYNDLWNNKSMSSCTNYFCGANIPFLLALGNNMSFSQTDRAIYLNEHMLMHTYCTLCVQTKLENFTNTTCPWVTKDYCLPTCSNDSICLYYEYQRPICYQWSDNMFYRYYWNGSIGTYWFYFLAMPSIYVIESVVTLAYVLIFLVVPEIKEIGTRVRELPKGVSLWTKIRNILSIRSQCIVLLMISPMISISCSIIDLSSIFVIRLYTLGAFIRAGIILIVNGNIIVLWKHICEIADNLPGSDQNPPLSRVNTIALVCYYFACAVFIVSGTTFYALYTLVDGGDRIFWLYWVGGWIWTLTICLFVLVVILNIYSIKLWRMYNKGLINQANFMKLKFTRLVFFSSIVLLLAAAVSLEGGFQYVVGRDILSIIGYMLTSGIHFLCVVTMQWVVVIGLTDYRMVKNAWCCRLD